MSDTDPARLNAAARRGTSRTGLPEVTPTPLGAALKRVERDTSEAALLARAALAGLHLRAGRTPGLPTVPAPRFAPTELPAQAIPAALDRLLPALAQQPEVLCEALTLLHSTGGRLNAVQARPLLALNDGGGDPLCGSLWPVLNEHARWMARLHPVWKRQDPDTLSASAGLASLRRELVEAHVDSPERTAADLTARWPTFRADERRVVLNAVAGSIHPADWRVLELAMNDKLPGVRRQAWLLQGHLPGEVQDAVWAALSTWFRLVRGRLAVVQGEYLPALGEVDGGTVDSGTGGDSELARLLGALPVTELPGLLGVQLPEIRRAIGKFPGHVGGHTEGNRGRVAVLAMERTALAGADLETLLGFDSDPGDLLEFWLQMRIQARWWESAARLLEPGEMNAALLRLTLQLLGALETPLPVAPADLPAPKKGLLARVASALGVGKTEPGDWPARLHALTERLLLALSREVSSYQLPIEALMSALTIHLDPARPDPSGPEPVRPTQLPDGADKKRQEAQTVALILHGQQTRARAKLYQTLTLRRQVRAALAGETLAGEA